MKPRIIEDNQDRLLTEISRLWNVAQDQADIAKTVKALDSRYELIRKLNKEPGVEDIIQQMAGRLARSYPMLSDLRGKRILDIACGSNTSRFPGGLSLKAPFGLGQMAIVRASRGYTTLFEPWFCRILYELGAIPVGIDFGDLDGEVFIHHKIDLGKIGGLDFLPEHSFDGIQDSRLFGSPEFTAQFPRQDERMIIALEIVRQEQRILKNGGIIIHSDAAELIGSR
jgi:hypothetical protein